MLSNGNQTIPPNRVQFSVVFSSATPIYATQCKPDNPLMACKNQNTLKRAKIKSNEYRRRKYFFLKKRATIKSNEYRRRKYAAIYIHVGLFYSYSRSLIVGLLYSCGRSLYRKVCCYIHTCRSLLLMQQVSFTHVVGLFYSCSRSLCV